jgi:hypothetical protein
MGQPVTVVRQPQNRPGLVRYEANRTLTGMGHERFRSADEAHGSRPAAELARRFFATGQVEAVHVHGNMVTVDLAKGFDDDGLDEVLRNLYQYWKPGMEPPAFEELTADEPAEAPAASAGDAGDAALSEAAKRVPAALLERSRQARERWKAKSA